MIAHVCVFPEWMYVTLDVDAPPAAKAIREKSTRPAGKRRQTQGSLLVYKAPIEVLGIEPGAATAGALMTCGCVAQWFAQRHVCSGSKVHED